MDIHAINECLELSHVGKITFLEVAQKLAAASAQRYIVDLIGLKMLYYGNEDETYTAPFSFKNSKVALEFNPQAVQSAIKDIQQQKIDYHTFLNLIMKAGCSHYEVFITGKKAIYTGRDGSHHIEHFPQSSKGNNQ